MRDIGYFFVALMALVAVALMAFDSRAPLTEDQQRAAWAQQRATDNAYRPETLSPAAH